MGNYHKYIYNDKLNYSIAIIGLGYVGFPLLEAFSKTCYNVIGYDKSTDRIKELSSKYTNRYNLTNKSDDLKYYDIYIIAVPTPVDSNNKPDLSNIIDATLMVADILQYNVKMNKIDNEFSFDNIICYESSVAPTTINTVCKQLLELRDYLYNPDDDSYNFSIAHSPERINPGDSEHTVDKITKIVAANDENTINILKKVYNSIMDICNGGRIITTSSIEAAEAAKMLENVQRDVNIALMNEYALLMDKLNIDMNEVLRLSRTRWNFCNFTNGLVGGHCVAVDPYYIVDLDEKNTTLIQTARKINEYVPSYIANKTLELIDDNNIKKPLIGILGFAFKENCDDIRNTKVYNIYKLLTKIHNVVVFDDIIDKNKVNQEYNLEINNMQDYENTLDCIIIAVPHDIYKNDIYNICRKLLKKQTQIRLIIDIKGIYDINSYNALYENTVVWGF